MGQGYQLPPQYISHFPIRMLPGVNFQSPDHTGNVRLLTVKAADEATRHLNVAPPPQVAFSLRWPDCTLSPGPEEPEPEGDAVDSERTRSPLSWQHLPGLSA